LQNMKEKIIETKQFIIDLKDIHKTKEKLTDFSNKIQSQEE